MEYTADEHRLHREALQKLAARMIEAHPPICDGCGKEYHVTHIGEGIAVSVGFYNEKTKECLKVPKVEVMCWCTFCYPDDSWSTEGVTLGTLPKEFLEYEEHSWFGDKEEDDA